MARAEAFQLTRTNIDAIDGIYPRNHAMYNSDLFSRILLSNMITKIASSCCVRRPKRVTEKIFLLGSSQVSHQTRPPPRGAGLRPCTKHNPGLSQGHNVTQSRGSIPDTVRCSRFDPIRKQERAGTTRCQRRETGGHCRVPVFSRLVPASKGSSLLLRGPEGGKFEKL